ncbi:SusC/RagA family TonB-linked outer membrane protein, partial [Flavobacterium sp. CSZ]|nr:SusC/RagA family TonB-linked outer membrane protein [Flavobacterium sp. CSZ]
TGYGIQNNNQPSADLTSSSKYLAPNAPALYDADGNLNWANNTWLNPLRNLVAEFRSNTKDLVSSTTLSYEILPDLTIKSNFGYSDLQNIETRINPSTIYNPASGATSALSALYLNNTQRNSWIIEPQINWEINLGTSKIDVIL